MTITLADEIRGEVRRGKRANARVVILNGWSELARADSLVEQRAETLRIRRKNAKTWANRKNDPVKAAARAAYMVEWRRTHPQRVKGYRKTYRRTHAAWSRKYQREWKRARYQAKGGPARGEAHPVAKLTAEKVREMRARFERAPEDGRKESLRALGAAYGVSFTSARKIVRREMWAHV